MNKKPAILVRLLILVWAAAFGVPGVESCTTFVLQDEGRLVFGRNLDWHVGEGLVIANPRQVRKRGLVLPMGPRETDPAEWVAKYGSVTFNSLGRDFPTGGMNEAGLVVEVMWLEETQYPAADSRKELHVLQWTQYLLDTCRTIDEVMAVQSKVRISPDSVLPQHFLVADALGGVAVMEFLGGKLVVHRADHLPHACLANSTYEESIRQADHYRGVEGWKTPPAGESSVNRFIRTAEGVDAFAAADREIVEYAFELLDGVNQGYELNEHSTVWSVVYDIRQRQIHFRTHNHRAIRRLDLLQLSFDCAAPVPVWDVLAKDSGDITSRGMSYSFEVNKATATKNVNHPSIQQLFGDMSALIDPVSHYVDQFTVCVE